MKVKNVNDYVKELSEVFPEVAPESIAAVIKVGNSSILQTLRGKTATVQLKSKSKVDSTTNVFTFYNYTTAKYNNIAKIIKKRKDEKNAK